MRTQPGDKTIITLPNGTRFPFVVTEEETISEFTLRDGTVIEVSRVDGISLRAPKDDPDSPYLYLSNETVMFGYKSQMQTRRNHVVGLDVTEDGTLIDLDTLVELRGDAYSKFLADRSAERNPVTDAADL